MDVCVYTCMDYNSATPYKHTLDPRADSHMQTHFFSPANAPSVYFVTETENHNTNNMPHALFSTTCSILDKGTDTQSLSLNFPPVSFSSFSEPLWPLHSSNLPHAVHVFGFSLNLTYFCDKKPRTHGDG